MVGVGGSSPLRRTIQNPVKLLKKVLANDFEVAIMHAVVLRNQMLTKTTQQSAFSSAWLEHHLDMVGVGGSSPLRRTIQKMLRFR